MPVLSFDSVRTFPPLLKLTHDRRSVLNPGGGGEIVYYPPRRKTDPKLLIHLYSMNEKKGYFRIRDGTVSHVHENPDLKRERKDRRKNKVEYSKSRLRPLFSIKIPNHSPSFLRRDPWERKRRGNIFFSLSLFCFCAVFTLLFLSPV